MLVSDHQEDELVSEKEWSLLGMALMSRWHLYKKGPNGSGSLEQSGDKSTVGS